MTTIRALSSYEKKLLLQSTGGYSNGTSFGANYSNCKDAWSSDDATLISSNDNTLTLPVLTRALNQLISKNIELLLTINENYEFEILKKIKTDDIISRIEFDTPKDELINCHLGAPPYLLRHIFNSGKFEVGTKKPLWGLYIIDKTKIFFHGQDCLFDTFSCANFHKLLLVEINNIFESCEIENIRSSKILEHAFDFTRDTLKSDQFPRSIYDNAKLYLPASDPDLFNLQTQSFFKSIYFNTVKKPFDFITNEGLFNNNSNSNTIVLPTSGSYTDILDIESKLCGITVFGNITNERFKYLNSLVEEQNICFKSFIVGVTMLCLKPTIKSFNGNLTFSITIDLRKLVSNSRELGLYYKDILVECPLSLLDDTQYNLDKTALNYRDSLLEEQFIAIAKHVNDYLDQRLKRFSKTGFNDDDIRRMKLNEPKKLNRYIKINDVSRIELNEPGSHEYKIDSCNIAKSLSIEELLSISYTYCEENGLNICIHYPEGYKMDSFMECFQIFLEED